MFTLKSNIAITITDNENNQFTVSNFPICNVEIKRSRKELTATAKITMPRNFNYTISKKAMLANPNLNLNTFFKRGSQITIQIGYREYGLYTEFTGYITQVSSGYPLELECQDEMWKLKQTNFTKTWKAGTKVYQILEDIYPVTGTGRLPSIAPPIQIGGLVAIKQSAAQILDQLRKYGFHCYFDTDWSGQNLLIVDFAEALHPGTHINYQFGKNVVEYKNLCYKSKDDVLIRIDAVSMLPNGKIIKPPKIAKLLPNGKTKVVTDIIGDADGEVHTLTYFNLSQDDLTQIANKELAKLKYDGYRGYFTTFGYPLAKPGDMAVLVDPINTDRNGTYLIEAVETSFGIKGFRRKITLERLLSQPGNTTTSS